MPTSDHFAAAELARSCAEHGISFAVTSPGSRSAPLVIAFSKQEGMTCLQVIDERSAAFFALGMAEQLGAPVVLICTSGSAILNYGPAVAEAYYRRIPLLVISADRPAEWIDQGEGQAIRQPGVLALHTRLSIQLPRDPEGQLERWHCVRSINEALDATKYPLAGPVHVNVPFSEPLYGSTEVSAPNSRSIVRAPTESFVRPEVIEGFGKAISLAKRVLILVGQGVYSERVLNDLRALAKLPQISVFTEATSNLDDSAFITCIDRVIEGVNHENSDRLAPDLLITFGGAIISKRIKVLLREWRPQQHWHVDAAMHHYDTYQSLTTDIAVDPVMFLTQLKDLVHGNESTYRKEWIDLDKHTTTVHHKYLLNAPWCDLTAIRTVLDQIPEGSDVHLANSTPARYAQLFERTRGQRFWSNRGTSGIDGCTSTALGAAYASGRKTTLITGDTAFLYDGNAFWNAYRSPGFRVIVIDNGGGNIFRYIEGPDQNPELLSFFEAPHGRDPLALARSFDLPCFEATDIPSLKHGLMELYGPIEGPAVLVVRTDANRSPEVLREYFGALRAGSLGSEPLS